MGPQYPPSSPPPGKKVTNLTTFSLQTFPCFPLCKNAPPSHPKPPLPSLPVFPTNYIYSLPSQYLPPFTMARESRNHPVNKHYSLPPPPFPPHYNPPSGFYPVARESWHGFLYTDLLPPYRFVGGEGLIFYPSPLWPDSPGCFGHPLSKIRQTVNLPSFCGSQCLADEVMVTVLSLSYLFPPQKSEKYVHTPRRYIEFLR